MNPPPRSLSILGTPVHCLDYEGATEYCRQLARADKPALVSLCNTHIVSAARHDAAFGRVMREFDLVLPDGMPLIWTLNARGAGLRDRVYGPYFMRHLIVESPRPWKHFLFGGTAECLESLQTALLALQPDLEIVGSISPPFREWTEQDQQDFADTINASGADFIWVALGGERQERWMVENLHHFKRGVFFAVGDAFELLAGRRPFAPEWMQRQGLTWAYRLLLEPRRLLKRYTKYNTLFLSYLLLDTIAPPPEPGSEPKKGHLVFIGSRGTPARYAGFETVVEQLGKRLARRGFRIGVHNRRALYRERPPIWEGMEIRYLPAVPLRNLETISHAAWSTLLLLFSRCDVVYLCGVGNAILAMPLRLAGIRVIANVDGIDYKRPKWSGFARWWLHMSERWVIRHADRVIADNQTVVRHYQEEYNYSPVYLAYGAKARPPASEAESKALLAEFGLKSKGYILCVSRISRENELTLLIRAYTASGVDLPLVITGDAGYEKQHMEELRELAGDKVIFTGGVYGSGYAVLSRNACFFVLPAAIEATRLVLLDQMAFGNAVLYRDCEATREVIGDAGESFLTEDPVADCAEKIRALCADPARVEALGRAAAAQAATRYDWDHITDAYEAMILELLPAHKEEIPA